MLPSTLWKILHHQSLGSNSFELEVFDGSTGGDSSRVPTCLIAEAAKEVSQPESRRRHNIVVPFKLKRSNLRDLAIESMTQALQGEVTPCP